jgi:hypothetical protein
VIETDDSRTKGRAAIAAFAVVELFALVLWLVLGRSLWFYSDEWDYLVTRKAGDLGDLFRPHNEHWQTLPILIYRGLYGLFGLRTYLPYQLIVVVLHLTAAALLLVVMRRALVRPWIATAAASLFALFGAGSSNIVRAFQIGFEGSLVLGLTQLLFADHDGGLDRRDWLGLLAGLLGLMTSGVAVTMTVVVGLAVLVRRGWRIALFHIVPLGAGYATWLLVIGHSGYKTRHPTLDATVRFVVAGLRGAYRALGQLPGVGGLLAIVLVVGFVIAYLQRRQSGVPSELIVPGALLAGSVLFLAVSATGRVAAFGPEFARESRYTHLVAAMTLPALAVAADALTTRSRWVFPIVISLFLVGIPGNVRALADASRKAGVLDQGTRRMVLSIPRDPRARQVPRDLRPERAAAPEVTVGWLLDAAARHKLPAPRHVSAADIAAADFRLSFDQRRTVPPSSRCERLTRLIALDLKKDDVIGVFDNQMIVRPTNGRLLVPSIPIVFDPRDGSSVVVLRDVGVARIGPRSPFYPPRACTLAP